MTETPSLLVGLMSGTSLDGMDAALVRFRDPTHAELVAFHTRPYAADERDTIRDALQGASAPVLARLHVRLGEWACEAVEQLLAQAHVPATALAGIAFHGQTIWHEPPTVSWQLGEAAVLAERFGVRVVSNFRARDVAAGGQGAPLVPAADVLLFGAAEHPRVLLNLGGMANLTYVPHAADETGAFAFDTGPGVAILDAVARLVDPALPYDVDGRLAAEGTPNEAVLLELLADPFFQAPPPKSTGRELFGDAYARVLHELVPGVDGVATAVELTARSVAEAVSRWVPGAPEVVVSGGGAHHPGLMDALARRLDAACGGRDGGGVVLRRFDELFFPGDAKEAVAFALLGYLTLHGQPGNVPAATGAAGPRVLGQITPA
ncbi:MAG TPA: anhydro-N-acetylmuramic acid kinase [Gemmatimonadales bacterium]|nr:anhydro-N-acetylmuramic acid kinase [Gemmatimonadales bacterium]